MSQHDMNLANQSGASFRADLNLALLAIVSQSSGDTEPETTFAYQFWCDTSGANPILKIRNAANNAWITIGRVDIANFGLLPLTGGTLSAALLFSNTDYMKLPVGTSLQRPGSPANGMIRFNSTLSIFEGYKSGAWSQIGGGGGGGGALRWIQGPNSPTVELDLAYNEAYKFQSGLGQTIYTQVKVPKGYTAGSQVKLYTPFYSPDDSGTALITATSTLIRPGTTLYNAITNQYTSTNTAVTLGATVNIPQMVTMDLTDSSGQINSVAIQADDIIGIALSRGVDTAASDLAVLPYGSEITFS